MDLDTMKYPKLRSLAKELGLKSNMKADKILKAIKQHYEQQQQQQNKEEHVPVNGELCDSNTTTLDSVGEESSVSEEEPNTGKALFVTSRRGRKTKRKISDGDQPLPTAQMGSDRVDPEEPETTVLFEGAKRRMVSATTELEPTRPLTKQQAVGQPDHSLQSSVCNPGKEVKVGAAGRIPRYEGLLKKTNRPPMKPNTPNFKKLHEAHFNKMESIDSYIDRIALKSSTKGLKVKPSRASVLSPVVMAKPAVQKEPAFRPSVLSMRRINVRFSEATLANKPKKSLLRTPARMPSCVAQSTLATQSSEKPSIETPGAFVFSGNASFSTTPGTNKPSFDLKASLSKPLSYKPHKGKLKPFGATKDNDAANTSVVQLHNKNYKQHAVQTREERRTRQTQDRKQKKESALGARRGLLVS